MGLRISAALLLLVTWFSAAAGAQPTIRVLSSFAGKHSAPRPECSAEAAILSATLARYPHPDSWTYVIACDDNAWNLVLTHLGLQNDGGIERYGETDFSDKARITYLRGLALLHPSPAAVTADGVIAHELAHIQLHTRDEELAEAEARRWIHCLGSASEHPNVSNMSPPGAN